MENFEEFKKVQTAFRLVDKDFSVRPMSAPASCQRRCLP